ncbi:MAG: ArsR family transcriptional regulator [Phycisphaera sp.]|nr:MAG: ArsR family transcriptional regulator [Phycisphaera sp.]
MTSACKHISTPKEASRKRADMDRFLDPELFRLLSEPTRVKLLSCLIKCGRPCSVTEIAECCSIDFSVVSRHLASMAKLGVLDASKEGRTVWYEARTSEIADRFRAIADSVDQWKTQSCCGGAGCDCD